MKRTAILYAILIVILVLAADTRHLGSLRQVYDFPGGDKVGHFVLFGILSLLMNLSVLQGRPAAGMTRSVILYSLLLAGLVGLEELSQQWIPSRTSSVLDLAASYAGIAFFAWLALRIRMRRAIGPEPGPRTHG
jgi:VanZ family protein